MSDWFNLTVFDVSFAQVTVVKPPSMIRVALHTGKTVTFTVTADEGSPLRLSCIVNGGRPRPRVWWTLHNKTHEFIVDETYEAIDGERTQNDLMLPRLTPDHHMTRLACHASNTNATEPITSRLTLLLNNDPMPVAHHPAFRFFLLFVFQCEERRLSIVSVYVRVGCETFGSRPAPILTWTIKRPDRLEEMLATEGREKWIRDVRRGMRAAASALCRVDSEWVYVEKYCISLLVAEPDSNALRRFELRCGAPSRVVSS
ncbi:hypothetical protein E2C01_035734 [Portunus trituberculatus]|uniref:Ig-like domain-containing protein n=1 Tax=Portunus trituberculatus TaxID=210409 RepID=A0A5B7F3Y4_PORTR|nr:hypothetical protein [Portunus trituberculatus]